MRSSDLGKVVFFMSKQKNNMNKKAEPRGRMDLGYENNSIPGINTPEISPPAFNPPVPNRAWTAMRAGVDIDELSEEEKRELYYGRDAF